MTVTPPRTAYPALRMRSQVRGGATWGICDRATAHIPLGMRGCVRSPQHPACAVVTPHAMNVNHLTQGRKGRIQSRPERSPRAMSSCLSESKPSTETATR